MRFSLVYLLSAVCAIAVVSTPAAYAGFEVFYQEDFSGQDLDGIQGPVPPFGANGTSFSNSSWSVDGVTTQAITGGPAPAAIVPPARLVDGNDFARVSGERFRFRDIGGNTSGGPGTGSAVFQTMAATLAIGNPANFAYLTMTINTGINAIAPGSSLLIESFIDGVLTDFTLLDSANSNLTVTHNLQDNVSQFGVHSYVLRVTATQNLNATFSIDDILVSGVSTPEPASMSLLGMGVLAMCGAGYRRRRNLSTVET